LNFFFFVHAKREMSRETGRLADELITKVGEAFQPIGQKVFVPVYEE
jgi:hypothetical protein